MRIATCGAALCWTLAAQAAVSIADGELSAAKRQEIRGQCLIELAARMGDLQKETAALEKQVRLAKKGVVDSKLPAAVCVGSVWRFPSKQARADAERAALLKLKTHLELIRDAGNGTRFLFARMKYPPLAHGDIGRIPCKRARVVSVVSPTRVIVTLFGDITSARLNQDVILDGISTADLAEDRIYDFDEPFEVVDADRALGRQLACLRKFDESRLRDR